MRKFLTILTTILVLACSSNHVPSGVLTAKEITPILVEIHLAEGLYAQRFIEKITRENYQEDLYLSVLKKFKCDQKVFEASLLYYGKYPEKYQPIYDEVLNRLNEMQVKYTTKDPVKLPK